MLLLRIVLKELTLWLYGFALDERMFYSWPKVSHSSGSPVNTPSQATGGQINGSFFSNEDLGRRLRAEPRGEDRHRGRSGFVA